MFPTFLSYVAISVILIINLAPMKFPHKEIAKSKGVYSFIWVDFALIR